MREERRPVQANAKFWRNWRLKILAGALVAMILAACGLFLFPQEVLTVDTGPVKAEVLVVLGGAPTERPQRGAELFKAGEAPLIVCSGNGDAESDKEILIKSGVPAKNILLDPKSLTTKENAKFTIALLRAQHVTNAIIVTSWYHSRRALACFEHYAPDIHFFSRPSYASYSKAEWPAKGTKVYIKAEYVKLLGYWLLYGVCPIAL